MNRLLRICVFAAAAYAVAPIGAQTPTPAQKANQVNVLSYNIRNARGMDERVDFKRLADAIKKADVDVVAVQEVDSATRRSGGLYVLGELADELLMHPVFAPAIDYDGGKYGIGILLKERPLSVRRIPLPGREEERVLLIAEFDRYILANTHLSLTPEDALASTEIILRETQSADKPVILTGDWNSEPQSDVVEAIKKNFRILNNPRRLTWPADKPEQCIDYIALCNPGAPTDTLMFRRAAVLQEPMASDHRPVRASLQFAMPASEVLYHAPYLQRPTKDGITVMFQTNAISRGLVEYGTDTTRTQLARHLIGGQEACCDIEHKVRLTGLTPGRKYFYRILTQEIVDYQSYSHTFGKTHKSPWYEFTLPAADTDTFTALVLNDLHEVDAVIDTMAVLAATIPHDLVIFNGDCLPEPDDRDHAIRAIHRLADAFNLHSVPAVFIRGNHEIRNAYSAGMPSLFDNPDDRTYGAFNWGDTRFVTLDCCEDKPDDTWVYAGLNDFTDLRREQCDFLREELKSDDFKNAKARILVHHIPIWGNGDKYTPCSEAWIPILKGAPFNVDLAGHNHEAKVLQPDAEAGRSFPVVIGGAPRVKDATMTVVRKRGDKLTVEQLDAAGNATRCL